MDTFARIFIASNDVNSSQQQPASMLWVSGGGTENEYSVLAFDKDCTCACQNETDSEEKFLVDTSQLF
jgi:hypothetical protein